MNASECLRDAARIESTAKDLYAELAVTFAQHAMRIRLLERHHGRAPWSQETLERFQVELAGMLEEIEAVRKLARSSGGARNAGALLRRLTRMESRFGSLHAEELARSAAPAVQKLFASLALQDAKHSEMIRKAETRARE